MGRRLMRYEGLDLEGQPGSPKPDGHCCCLYEDHEERHAVIAAYVAKGLSLGQKVICRADNHKADAILERLRQHGLYGEQFLETGQLRILSASKPLPDESTSGLDDMMAHIHKEAKLVLSRGFTGLRALRDVPPLQGDACSFDQLLGDEAEADASFPENCALLCMYDRREFPPNILAKVVSGHPFILIGGETILNPFWVHPEKLVGRHSDKAVLSGLEHGLKVHHRALNLATETEEKYRFFFHRGPAGNFVTDREGRVLEVNQTGIDDLGYSRRELADLGISHLYADPADREQILAELQCFGKVRQREVLLRSRTGEPVSALVSSELLRYGGKELILTTGFDMTTRKKREEMLRVLKAELEAMVEERTADLRRLNKQLRREIRQRKASERALRLSKDFTHAVLTSIEDHVAVLDCEGRIIAVNRSWTQFCRENGLREGAACVGADYFAVSAQAVASGDGMAYAALQGLRSVIDGFAAHFEMDYPCHSPTRKRWFRMRVIPFRGKQGAVVVSHTDITALKLAMIDMAAREANFQKAEEVARIVSWSHDLSSDLFTWSGGTHDLLGVSPGVSVTRRQWREIIHPDDREHVKRETTGLIENHSSDLEYRIVVGGDVKWVRAKARLESDEAGRPTRIVGIAWDITRRKALEEETSRLREEMTHASRLATVGELTHVLAHEFNQPLSAMLLNAEAALRLVTSGNADMDELREILGDIIEDNGRARDIMKRLHALVKKETGERSLLSINDIITDSVSLVRTEVVRRKVKLSVKLMEGLPRVCGDRIQLQQVTLNLLLNSLDALNHSQISAEISIRTGRTRKGVSVEVSDTGMGIKKEMIDHVFEPFTTTKLNGLGLGLSISRSIISAHGGTIRAVAKKGKGATIVFALPSGEAKEGLS